jgi:hypothetical protein
VGDMDVIISQKKECKTVKPMKLMKAMKLMKPMKLAMNNIEVSPLSPGGMKPMKLSILIGTTSRSEFHHFHHFHRYSTNHGNARPCLSIFNTYFLR